MSNATQVKLHVFVSLFSCGLGQDHARVKKMTESANIVVAVLEAPYASLHKYGVPLPVCLCMQGKGIQLGSAQWTAKQSHSGFSISFFWPSLSEHLEHQ